MTINVTVERRSLLITRLASTVQVTFLETGTRTVNNTSGGAWGTITGTLSAQTDLSNALALKAPLASPALTGNPTAPTQSANDNSTKIATTAYVDTAAGGGGTEATLAEALAGTNTTTRMSPRRTRNVTERVYNVEAYGAEHDGERTLDGAITSGLAVLTSASNPFTSADVGKIIVVSGAGAAGVAHKTTIASYQSAGQVTLTASASTTVSGIALVYWGTDDTVAIQAASDACFAAGGGDVYFPIGIYIINGALQTSVDGVNPNCQLYLKSHQSATAPITLIKVRWVGESRFPQMAFIDPLITGTVLLSTLTSSSGTLPAVIGSKGLSGNYLDFNADGFEMENICIMTHSNKGVTRVLSAFNGQDLATGSLRNCVFTIDSRVDTSTTPSAFEHFGAWLGRLSNNGPNIIANCSASGYKYGWILGEHTEVQNVMAIGNLNGFVFIQGNYSVNGYVQAIQNAVNILVPNATLGGYGPGNVYLNLLVEVEVPTGSTWYLTTSHLTDSGNRARGVVSLLNSADGTYVGATLMTGGTALTKRPFNSAIPIQLNQAGGNTTSGSSAHDTDNGIIEANSGQAASTSDKFAVFQAVANQANTSTAPIGHFQVVNSNIGGTEKRSLLIGAYTNGATNSTIVYEYVLLSGTLTEVKNTTGVRVAYNLPAGMKSYTVATVPSASTAGAGATIYVSNESGGAVLAFSDGTNWRRVTDRAVVS